MLYNNLPSKCEKSIFTKIKILFIKWFNRNNKVENRINTIQKDMREDIFFDMGKLSRNEYIKEDIFNMVRHNPDLLSQLTISQLEEINNIYDKKIKDKEQKIKKIKRNLTNA